MPAKSAEASGLLAGAARNEEVTPGKLAATGVMQRVVKRLPNNLILQLEDGCDR